MNESISTASLTKPEPGLTIAQAVAEGAHRLSGGETRAPRLDAEVLLAHTLGWSRTRLFMNYDAPVSMEAYRRYESLLARRLRGEPVQYITGLREFWGLEFHVTPDVLIPRPETEHLVEQALDILRRKGPPARPQIVDVGTGSGCLAIALASACPAARVLAVDIYAPALRVARENARRHGVSDRIGFVQADGLSSVALQPPRVDLIVCNPPYIAPSEFETLPHEVRDFEPRIALTDEADGLTHYRRLIPAALERLRAGGHLIFEVGAGQASAVARLFDSLAWETSVMVKDLQGIDRILATRTRRDGGTLQ